MSAARLGAQTVSARIGGVRASYADSLSGAAAAIGLRGAVERPSWRLLGDVTHARFTSGAGSSTQASTALTLARPAGALSLGLQGMASASFLTGGVSAWSGSAQGFVALVSGPWLASLGASAGGLRTVAGVSHGLFGGAARLRRDVGPFAVEGAAAFTASGTTRYTDATVGASLTRGVWNVDASGGARLGGLEGGTQLGQADAELRLAPRLFLDAAVGRSPRDLTGFTSGTYVTLGFRVPLAGRAAVLPSPARVEVRLEAPDRARVTLEVPHATHVAIVGEWNAWTPAPMTRLGGDRWQAWLPLGRGAYRFAVVVDGGHWVVPPGVPRLNDDFGGQVGVLVIGG